MTNEEAIKELRLELRLIADITIWNDRREALDMAIEALKGRPTGHWIESKEGYFHCSNCQKMPIDQISMSDFCPNCGADMRGKEEERRRHHEQMQSVRSGDQVDPDSHREDDACGYKAGFVQI